MKVFGIVGWSGSGKTTMIEALLPELRRLGFSVSTMKHVHEDIDLDRPAKDSFRHRLAGATEVVLLSPRRWTLMHEVRDAAPPSPTDLLPRLSPVDLVLLEGFKTEAHDKLEVWRADLGKPPLHASDTTIVAVAGDPSVADRRLACFGPADIVAIAAFIVRHCGLASPSR